MAAEGASNRDIGAAIDMHYNQVAVWRRRYAQFGLAGLADGERHHASVAWRRGRPDSATVLFRPVAAGVRPPRDVHSLREASTWAEVCSQGWAASLVGNRRARLSG
jgi:hypothetical protein